MVFDHPLLPHSRTPTARFTLDDVPAGSYQLSAWHERIGESINTDPGRAGRTGARRVRAADGRPMITRLFGPPRLVVRTSVATFAVVALVLTAVLLLIAIQGSALRPRHGHRQARGRTAHAVGARAAPVARAAGAGRQLAENPTLKAAIDTYQAELAARTPAAARELIADDRARARQAGGPDPGPTCSRSPIRRATSSPRSGRPSQRLAAFMTRRRAKDRRSRCVVAAVRACSGRVSAPLALADAEIGVAAAGDRPRPRLRAASSRRSPAPATLIASDGRVIATTLPADAASELDADVVQSLPGPVDASTLGDANTRSGSCSSRPATRSTRSTRSTARSAPALCERAERDDLAGDRGVRARRPRQRVDWRGRSSRPIDTLSRSLSRR